MCLKTVATWLICVGWMWLPGATRGDESSPSGSARTNLRQLPIRFRQVDNRVANASVARTDSARSDVANSAESTDRAATSIASADERNSATTSDKHGGRRGESAPPLPLVPRSRSADGSAPEKGSGTGRAIATIVSSLVVVVGILVGLAAAARRFRPAVRVLPDDVFTHLGTTSLAGRQTIHLVRFGDKLMLIAATAAGLQTLGELTDAEEVERLSALCRPRRSSPIASSLQRVLADWTSEASAISKASRGGASVVISPTRVGEVSHA